MWDNQAWSYVHREEKETEPPFLAQDFIHATQPGARIVVMLRDPVERYVAKLEEGKNKRCVGTSGGMQLLTNAGCRSDS